MHLQNGFPSLDIRIAHYDLPVKPTRTHQRRIQDISSVGCGNDNHIVFSGKAVHFHQQLVQGLFPFVMAAADSGTAVSADCINFINKDDGRCIFLCLFKQIPHTGCTHADKHFHKVRTGDGEERTAGLSRNGSCQQGFTSTRRPHEQNALRNPCADFSVFPGIFQEIHDFLQFMLFLICPGHICKGGLSGVHLVFDIGFSERGVFSAAVCLPHHKDEQENHHEHQNDSGDNGQHPGGIPNLIVIQLQRCVRMLPVIVGTIIFGIVPEHGNIGHIIGDLLSVLQHHLEFAGAKIQRVFRYLIIIKILNDFGILRLL